jgi:hypothetical protein
MTKTFPTLFADFQNADPRGRVRLNCVGTVTDLGTQGVELAEGLRVRLSDGEVVTDGTATFSADEHVWVAVIDWDAVRAVA